MLNTRVNAYNASYIFFTKTKVKIKYKIYQLQV